MQILRNKVCVLRVRDISKGRHSAVNYTNRPLRPEWLATGSLNKCCLAVDAGVGKEPKVHNKYYNLL